YSNGAELYWTSVASTTSASFEVPLSSNIPAADITWKDGYFWGLGNGGTVVRVSPTGTVTTWSVPALSGQTAAGGAWTYGNGSLGCPGSASGDVVLLGVATPGAANPVFAGVSVISGRPSPGNGSTASLGSPVDLALAKTVSTD